MEGLLYSNTNDHRQVNDRWIFWWILPIVPLIVVHVGNDNSLAVLLKTPSYYSDLLLAFLVTYLTGYYLRIIYLQADRKFDWYTSIAARVKWLFIYSFLCPLFIALTIELLYLVLFLRIPLKGSSVFYLELPLFALVLLLLNFTYSFLYFRKYNATILTTFAKYQSSTGNKSDTKKGRRDFLVTSGATSVMVGAHEIAYFMVMNKTTFLVTLKNEKYLYNASLDKIMADLQQRDFFQLNRQIIASRQAIKGFENTATRKLSIQLFPSPADPVFVAKAKTGLFLEWLKAS
ncbi:LytTR family transcriptional regulator DNA-binding domain-containing protein [Flavihumibacter profundi]|uniref:LytTR family transcriptional regulator DNA-binding domain-containing protein n=1 Tax=Flavihumibacter profundi TaxID=2716883 RepID=UPI001CC42A56|nr:LytTR family transcriptional regulator DNA-binding domain-containing protein [Flavihumibacter profundi]MBZ5859580.1 LytTR family transcriptional regulator DNA-binding domain-containing protein [Flavihumibacter profundi]